jgi:hypothetical protein
MPINDGTGGFKAWRRSLLEKIDLDDEDPRDILSR